MEQGPKICIILKLKKKPRILYLELCQEHENHWLTNDNRKRLKICES